MRQGITGIERAKQGGGWRDREEGRTTKLKVHLKAAQENLLFYKVIKHII